MPDANSALAASVCVLGRDGENVQRHGRTTVPGLYTLGLKFQRRRGSHFIGGVGADAELLVQQLLAGDRRLARAA